MRSTVLAALAPLVAMLAVVLVFSPAGMAQEAAPGTRRGAASGRDPAAVAPPLVTPAPPRSDAGVKKNAKAIQGTDPTPGRAGLCAPGAAPSAPASPAPSPTPDRASRPRPDAGGCGAGRDACPKAGEGRRGGEAPRISPPWAAAFRHISRFLRF